MNCHPLGTLKDQGTLFFCCEWPTGILIKHVKTKKYTLRLYLLMEVSVGTMVVPASYFRYSHDGRAYYISYSNDGCANYIRFSHDG